MQRRGECISCPAAPHSSTACATVSPVLATHPKNALPQVPCLPHLRYPPEAVYLFLPSSGRLQQPNRRPAACGFVAFGHQSPFTSYQSPPFVLLRALSRGATIGPERRKYWETKPLLSVSK